MATTSSGRAGFAANLWGRLGAEAGAGDGFSVASFLDFSAATPRHAIASQPASQHARLTCNRLGLGPLHSGLVLSPLNLPRTVGGRAHALNLGDRRLVGPAQLLGRRLQRSPRAAARSVEAARVSDAAPVLNSLQALGVGDGGARHNLHPRTHTWAVQGRRHMPGGRSRDRCLRWRRRP